MANTPNPADSSSSDLANPVDSTPPSIEPMTTSSQEPISTVSADSPPPTPPSPLSPLSPPSPIPIPESPPAPETTPEPSEAVKPPEEKVDTDVQLPDNQTTREQQEAPKDIPPVDTEKIPDQLANFKPEPLESPQNAPSANLSAETLVKEDQNITDSTKKSFGDLLSSENQPPPTPSIPPIPSTPTAPSVTSPAPSVSFGDLIKDIKPEESVIPPPPPDSSSSVNSQPTTNNPQPISPLPATAQVSAGPSPLSPPSDLSAEASAKADQLSLRRQKANQVRSQKKAKHLSKIMELAKNTKSISNTDIQRLLRVSQSTATNYLSELSRKGMLKKQGIRGGAKYTL